MLEFEAAPFYRATLTLASLKTNLQNKISEHKTELKDGSVEIAIMTEPFVLSLIRSQLNELECSLKILNAKLSLISIERLNEQLDEETLTFTDLIEFVDEIQGRLRDELSIIKMIVLEDSKNKYYDPEFPLFGEDVLNKFQSASFEIDEAAKCYALNRPTACVFHLMRTMEIGIAAAAKCLGIADPVKHSDRNWGNILKEIKRGIDEKWPTSASRMNGDGDFFEAIHASLDAVRNPWRNATMHVENKYTDDEAEHIFVAVRGFMKKLASRCDEKGEPKA